ncbi:MAG: O-methyltransferase [Patescibacteria group bacterium]|nr:O-methyltransferase [Patescibacteria group bacterium]
MFMTYKELLEKHPIISEQIEKDELLIILKELERILSLDFEGDICEFGCFVGTTSLFIQRLLQVSSSKKKLYLYDSFEGLPEKMSQDQSAAGADFIPGELMASKSQLKLNFKKANLPIPKIKKAWFSDLKEKDLPKQICFAFLDGDFYKSVLDPLSLIEDRLTSGGIVIVDDYNNPALPGTKKAVDEFLRLNQSFTLLKVSQSLAIIHCLR